MRKWESRGGALPASGWRVVFFLAFAIAALARLIGVFLKFVFFFIELDDFTLQGPRARGLKSTWTTQFGCRVLPVHSDRVYD
ncbi:MAG TPA: hypothetical protein VN176_18570 [Verrucomicrobiae bacterium]|jgi:hypothetical protein|nr:hypothetical protein [Verrucomicrobiae bacterium]